jgi:pellino protein
MQTCVTEFEPDPDTDLFQIGRSADACINFVVIDTEVDKNGAEQYKANSTVSRYACRILCERNPPYTARIYAAAFDTTKKIKISTIAPTWSSGATNESDGLTTNGVMLMHPSGYFEQGVSPGEWREVTVMGNIRKVRAKRSAKTPGSPIPEANNILTDGCLVDLCGVTLMWRSAMGLEQTPTQKLLSDFRKELNDGFMHCPVGLQTLYIPKGDSPQIQRSSSQYASVRFPWVYLTCGHVHGPHEWKADQKETNEHRTCPVCRKVGPFVRLSIGEERGYCLDTKPPTHAFVPCGHMCSESTARCVYNVC